MRRRAEADLPLRQDDGVGERADTIASVDSWLRRWRPAGPAITLVTMSVTTSSDTWAQVVKPPPSRCHGCRCHPGSWSSSVWRCAVKARVPSGQQACGSCNYDKADAYTSVPESPSVQIL